MRARGVIVAEVIAKATTEVSFVQYDHVVEEFAPDGSDHALSERVLPRGARRGEDLGKTDGLHSLSKLSAEDAVAIADEKPGRRVVREGLDNLLRRPSRGRGIGHVEMYDSAAVMEEVSLAKTRSRRSRQSNPRKCAIDGTDHGCNRGAPTTIFWRLPRLERECMSIPQPVARPSRERRSRSPLSSPASESSSPATMLRGGCSDGGVRRPGAGQGRVPARVAQRGRGSGASFSGARCVREPW